MTVSSHQIALIRDPGELVGTCYIEFQQGEYRGPCWVTGSVFLDEESFGYIEKIFESGIEDYDYYSFMVVKKPQWQPILSNLRDLISAIKDSASILDLDPHVGFFFSSTRKNFAADFETNKSSLVRMVTELVEWLEKVLKNRNAVTILGM